MSDNTGALQQAQAKAQELLDAAKSGAIIPIRLPGQVEEIVNLIADATKEHDAELAEAKAAAMPEDMQSYMEDEAHFVGHAVHELRTPMTSIRGYSDMLGQMGALNDMQKQFLDVIKTNVRRMEGLLTDVSYINKIRKGTLKVQPKMDMFKNISMKIEKNVEAKATELERTLEFEMPQGLPLLNVDSDLLTEALTKLVDNALQYIPKGDGGKVTVTGSADGSTLVVSIADNGIGMTEEELSKLGEIYFRSDHDLVNEFKGSGLGIPIAYGMLDIIGAEVDVESTIDEGTTFTVRVQGMG